METLSTILYWVEVTFGLGFVIFIHELGHFLVAKWYGVKVEKFSIGFGPTLLGVKYGDTEYVIAAVLLGGFVKMLGEGLDDEANKTTDPRAFSNQPVGARMAILSAGVIMNVILGLGCFAIAYGRGMVEMPAKVGGTVAASPAYINGMKLGDEIVAVNGKRDMSWNSMTLKVRLSGQDEVLHFDVKRPGQDAHREMDIKPQREPGMDYPTIGIIQPSSLEVLTVQTPTGMENPPAIPAAFTNLDFKNLDVLVAAGPEGEPPAPLSDVQQYQTLLARNPDRTVVHVFEHKETPESASGTRYELALPPARIVDFGFRLTAEPISAIQPDSPADKAGFRVGDRILKVDDVEDFDPMRLPSLCYQKAGKPMTFLVERSSSQGPAPVSLSVTPNDSPFGMDRINPQEPLDIPGLGFCIPIRPRIQHVEPNSPAAAAGLKPGDVITAFGLPARPKTPAPGAAGKDASRTDAGQAGKPATDEQPEETVKLDEAGPTWPSLFYSLQFQPMGLVFLGVNNGTSLVRINPRPNPDWYFPRRGLIFAPMERKLPPLGVGAAMRRGLTDTVENIQGIYAMIRSLFQRRVGTKSMAGPVGILNIAYRAASMGLTTLIYFLGFISINLAVINFLPIPPLDGGQIAFLAAEKIRGKPLPESALIPVMYAGILLILCLFVFVTYQDVFRLIGEWTGARP